ncbi:MAG: hypothetical protein ACKKL6_03475 [Candidatus Komeilibacteria bacterium]
MFNNLLEKLKKVLKINTESPYYYLGVLAVALLVFSFSFYQAQSNIKEPFKIGMARFANVEVEKSDQVDLQDAEELKKMDSDGDGLSDYLELYVYGTSAYIEDTDSDGLGDRIEVVSGADPLCSNPDGCNTNLFDQIPTDLDMTIESYGGKEGLITELVKLGYPESEINVLSTQDMVELYEQTTLVLSGQGATDAASGLYNVSVEEVRAMLLNSGISEEELAVISDEDLMVMYEEALNENQISY